MCRAFESQHAAARGRVDLLHRHHDARLVAPPEIAIRIVKPARQAWHRLRLAFLKTLCEHGNRRAGRSWPGQRQCPDRRGPEDADDDAGQCHRQPGDGCCPRPLAREGRRLGYDDLAAVLLCIGSEPKIDVISEKPQTPRLGIGLQRRGQVAMFVGRDQAIGMAADEIVEAGQVAGSIGSRGLLGHGVAQGGGDRRGRSTFECRPGRRFTAPGSQQVKNLLPRGPRVPRGDKIASCRFFARYPDPTAPSASRRSTHSANDRRRILSRL